MDQKPAVKQDHGVSRNAFFKKILGGEGTSYTPFTEMPKLTIFFRRKRLRKTYI